MAYEPNKALTLMARVGAAIGLVVSLSCAATSAAQPRLDLAVVDALFDKSVLADGRIDGAVAGLRSVAEDTALSAADRAGAYLRIAHLHWRFGAPDAALSSVDKALGLHEGPDAFLLKARLLDARGQADAAAGWYKKAEGATELGDEKEKIRIRLTMIGVDDRNADALVALAGQRDQRFRNRAAVVLAILGYEPEAIGLYRVSDAFGKPFQQHIRLSEWAIKAEDFGLAQSQAWQAYFAANARYDALYALTVLVESYRKADAVDELLVRLRDHPGPNEDFLQTRIDLLVESGRYDEAIALYRNGGESGADVETRRRLIGLYEAAGRPQRMIEEYRRLIADEPGEVSWYAGLASHYMNIGSPEAALDVWAQMEAQNQDNQPALLSGGELMIQMGFFDEAVRMVERALAGHGDSAPALFFLFEGYNNRGQDEKALAVLARLKASLPPDAGELRDIADAYERLNRPEKALEIFQELEAGPVGLGYDETMRLAWLYSVTGEKEAALEIWQELWVSVESPARRTFAESQLMLLAAELNTLADIVVGLEEKLALGSADRNDVNLLVRIYVEVGDKISATEVIDEFARQSGQGEVERLEQLGRVHMLLQDFDAYDGVLRRLVEIDPENRVEHIRNIILNMLANDLAQDAQDRFADIRKWLDDLRSQDSEAVSGEFEAGILSMGGYNDDAIDSYRKALVQYPDHSDNLLLMSDLMKSAGRRDEAVALLQYVAEHAASDNEFVVAVDGIINMIGARTFGETLTPEIQAVFRWTQRIILERIAGREDKFYLYQLLSEIAQETEDAEGEFAAIENSLSQAGIRRASILRELITLSTEGFNPAVGAQRFGDTERKITYGRRLVGLKQELPPEIYIDLGKTLLDRGDTLGAEKSLDMVTDITGLINIVQTKAELFYEAGHADRALAYYNQALSSDRENLELLKRTGLLREENRQDEIANTWYFQALQHLMRRQPFVLRNAQPQDTSLRAQFQAPVDTSVTREYRGYYEGLVQGLLITWPAEPTAADERVAGLKALFDEELTNVVAAFADTEKLPLASYSRLDHIAGLIHRVAGAQGLIELGEHVDGRLIAHFADDQDYVDQLVGRYLAWGRPRELGSVTARAPVAEALQAEIEAGRSPLERRLARVAEQGDFETALQIALFGGDEAGLSRLFREQIAAGKLREGLARADAVLDDDAFRRMVAPLIPDLLANRPALIKLIAEDADLILRVEDRLGQALVPDAELLDWVLSPEAEKQSRRQFSFFRNNTWEFLKAKLPPEDLIRYYVELADRLQPNPQFPGRFFGTMAADILALELTAGQKRAMAEAFISYLSKQDFKNEFLGPQTLSEILILDAHPGNRSVIYEVADYWKQKSQSNLDTAAVLRAAYEGTEDDAFRALLRLSQEIGQRGYTIDAKLRNGYQASRARLIEIIMDGGDVSAADARSLYELEFSRVGFSGAGSHDRKREVALLQRLIAAFPEDDRYQREIILAYLEFGDRLRAEEHLRRYYDAHRDDTFLRAALFFYYVEDEKFVEALAIATDGQADLRDPAAVAELFEELERSRDFQPASSANLLRKIYKQSPARRFSGRHNVIQKRIVTSLRESVLEGRHDAAKTALRVLWRGVIGRHNAPDGQPYAALQLESALQLSADPEAELARPGFGSSGPETKVNTLARLIEAGAAPQEDGLLFSEIAKAPYSVAEFEAYLAALSDKRRKSLHQLYEFLASAYEANGLLDKRRDALSAELLGGAINDHDFTVWMLLTLRSGAEVGGRAKDAFAARAGDIADPSELQTLGIARLLARIGRPDAAADYLRLLATQLVRHGEFLDRAAAFRLRNQSGQPLMDLSRLVDEIVAILPDDRALAVLEDVLKIAGRLDANEPSRTYYHAFLLQSLQKLLAPAEVFAKAAQIAPSSVAPSQPIDRWQVPKLLEIARIQARAGDHASALQTLRRLVAARPAPEREGSAQEAQLRSYEQMEIARRLAGLYGFGLPAGGFGSGDFSVQEDLVYRHKRMFPGAPAQGDWEGAPEWIGRAAAEMTAWLDDDAVMHDQVVEIVLVAAYQLARAGDDAGARDAVSAVAAKISSDNERFALQSVTNVALLSRHLGVVLPTDLNTLIADRKILSARQEASVLRDLAEEMDAEAAFEAAVRISGGSAKLAVLEELRKLAVSAGRSDQAARLAAEVQEVRAAKTALALDEEAAGGDGTI